MLNKFYKVLEKLLVIYYICTMNFDYSKYMLLQDVQNSGRRIYMVSSLFIYLGTFATIFGFNGHLISYLAAFVLGAGFSVMGQIKNYYFNDLILGTAYRILLLVTTMYIGYQLMFIEFDGHLNVYTIKYPSEWKFFYCATPVMFILYTFIGAILSFPFKIISYALGYMADDFYVRNREVEYYYESDIMIKEMMSSYDKYNETELQAMKNEALRKENYEEAHRISLYLERNFPDT